MKVDLRGLEGCPDCALVSWPSQESVSVGSVWDALSQTEVTCPTCNGKGAVLSAMGLEIAIVMIHCGVLQQGKGVLDRGAGGLGERDMQQLSDVIEALR